MPYKRSMWSSPPAEDLLMVHGIDPCTAQSIRDLWRAQDVQQLRRVIDDSPNPGIFPPLDNSMDFRKLKMLLVCEAADMYGIQYLHARRKKKNSIHFCDNGNPRERTIVFTGSALKTEIIADIRHHFHEAV